MNEMNDQPEASASAETCRPNLLQRIFGIFASPKKILEDVACRPDWAAPFIIILLATLILTQLCLPAILADAEKAIEQAIEKQQLPAEQTERAREIGMAYTKNFSAITAGAYTIVASVIAAAILLFVGNIVLGGKANFRQVFSIYLWTGLVGILAYLIRVPVALQQGTMKVYLGPAVLFPPEAEQSALFRIAAALDVFTIWRVILLAIGFAAIYRLSLSKSITAVGTLYVLLIASSVIFAGAFGR